MVERDIGCQFQSMRYEIRAFLLLFIRVSFSWTHLAIHTVIFHHSRFYAAHLIGVFAYMCAFLGVPLRRFCYFKTRRYRKILCVCVCYTTHKLYILGFIFWYNYYNQNIEVNVLVCFNVNVCVIMLVCVCFGCRTFRRNDTYVKLIFQKKEVSMEQVYVYVVNLMCMYSVYRY